MGFGKIIKKTAYHLSGISPTLASKLLYRWRFGRPLNLKNPQRLNEKLMWLKLKKYAKNPTVTVCADKYAVREYLEKEGYGRLLNGLIGVWERVEDIPWETLPEKFAIKCNHGCGYNIICSDKSTFDVEKAKEKLNTWMRAEYWRIHAEPNYRDIPPRIICEEYLSGKDGKLPVDYKFYCFNGKPLYIGNFIERDLDAHTIVRGYFDTDWNYIPICKTEIDVSKFPRPETLEEMVKLAEELSEPFPFVRVDFYECDGKVIFGEFTFTPTGCLGTYYTEEAQIEYGKKLRIR